MCQETRYLQSDLAVWIRDSLVRQLTSWLPTSFNFSSNYIEYSISLTAQTDHTIGTYFVAQVWDFYTTV